MRVILPTFKLPPRVSIYPDQIYSINQAYLVPYHPSKIHSSPWPVIARRDSCLALASPALLLPLKWWCYKRHRRSQSWSEDLIVLPFLEMINEKDSLEICFGQSQRTAERQLNKLLTHTFMFHTSSTIFSICSRRKQLFQGHKGMGVMSSKSTLVIHL